MISSKGSAILGVLAASAVAMTLFFGVMQFMQNGRDSETRLLIHESANLINSSLASVLTDPTATKSILTDPANTAVLSCVSHAPFCANGASLGPLQITNYMGGAIGPNPTSGFTFGGAKCTAFNASHGTNSCPLRFEVYASISCPPQVGGNCTMANYQLGYQVKIYGRGSKVRDDPNYANLDQGSLLTYVNPATMKCYDVLYSTSNAAPGNAFIQFNDSECIASGANPCAPPPMADAVPANVATIIPWNAPMAGPPSSPIMWGVQCTRPFIAGSCDTVTPGTGVGVAGSINYNNGCFTSVPVHQVTPTTVDNVVQITGHCCQLSIPH